MTRIAIAILIVASIVAAVILMPNVTKPSAPAENPFPKELNVKFLDDGRKAKVLNDYTFIDPQGRTWTTPADYVSDGASIPQFLWSLTGGPFSGKYRKAAIIHDQYCDTRTRPWKQVHRVFYDAMIAADVDERKAAIMYLAVYRFGPRWNDSYTTPCPPLLRCVKAQENPIPYYKPSEFGASSGTLKLIEAHVDAAMAEGPIDLDNSFSDLETRFDDQFANEYRETIKSPVKLTEEDCDRLLKAGLTVSQYAAACGDDEPPKTK